jgi:hypothetical protein
MSSHPCVWARMICWIRPCPPTHKCVTAAENSNLGVRDLGSRSAPEFPARAPIRSTPARRRSSLWRLLRASPPWSKCIYIRLWPAPTKPLQ